MSVGRLSRRAFQVAITRSLSSPVRTYAPCLSDEDTASSPSPDPAAILGQCSVRQTYANGEQIYVTLSLSRFYH